MFLRSAVIETNSIPIEIRPLSSRMGAEVLGLDLREPLDDTTQAQIYQALVQYHVLALRNQDLSKDEQIRFSEQFGTLERHVLSNQGTEVKQVHEVTNLGPNGKPNGKLGSQHWHTDKSFRPQPSLATILHAKQLPPKGGDTCFADMCAAYDALPTLKKAELSEAKVIHSWELSRGHDGRTVTPEEILDAPPMAHPLVRIHPDSGRKALFMGTHASHIEGLPFDEGRELLLLLEAHADPRQICLSPSLASRRFVDVG